MDDKYFWTSESGVTIDDFLQKTKPSIITDDMTPWIWVKGTTTTREDPERSTKHAEATSKALDILSRLEEQHKAIQDDPDIPVRGKKGVKSKKQCRDETLEVVKKELEDLSIESKWTVGKWLFFPRGEAVDPLWATIAKSVAEGPLKEAGVDLAKVAPSPLYKAEGESSSHVICTYMDNVYDKAAVSKVLRVLLSEHGLEPSACKSDLYTIAGIDSKHPSGLRSSIWRPAELIEGGAEQIKKMKDEHRARVRKEQQGDGEKKATAGPDGLIDSDSEDEKVVHATKRKAPVADAVEKEDVKASPKPRAAPPPPKKAKSAAIKFQEEDIFGGSDSDDE